MQDLIDRLKAHWIAEGVAIRPGASTKDIQAFETRYRVALPADLRAYFAAVDGTDDWVADRYFFNFLPLSKCLPIAEYSEPRIRHDWANRYFLLVDHSLSVFYYAIRLKIDPAQPSPVVLWDGPVPGVVASSFTDFLERYLLYDRSLYRVGDKINL